jgi:hypothetical protein
MYFRQCISSVGGEAEVEDAHAAVDADERVLPA